MALWYTVQIQRVKFHGAEFKLLSSSENKLRFFPKNVDDEPYALDVDYLTGEKTYPKKLFSDHYKEVLVSKKVQGNFEFDDVEIEIMSPPEEGRAAKNLGVGAAVGAVLVGPIGAVVGAWAGTKTKNVGLKISIPKEKLVFLGQVQVGFLTAWEKGNSQSYLKNDF